jgi:hypothetical protein
MNLACPYCRSAVPIADVNVATDIALCRQCGSTFAFSENIPGPGGATPDKVTPPDGTWFEQLPSGFRLGASTRSWLALFFVPFTCVWAGGALGGIYGGQLKRGHWQLFPSLFGLPFLFGSCALIVCCAMLLAGKIELTKEPESALPLYGRGHPRLVQGVPVDGLLPRTRGKPPQRLQTRHSRSTHRPRGHAKGSIRLHAQRRKTLLPRQHPPENHKNNSPRQRTKLTTDN